MGKDTDGMLLLSHFQRHGNNMTLALVHFSALAMAHIWSNRIVIRVGSSAASLLWASRLSADRVERCRHAFGKVRVLARRPPNLILEFQGRWARLDDVLGGLTERRNGRRSRRLSTPTTSRPLGLSDYMLQSGSRPSVHVGLLMESCSPMGSFRMANRPTV